MFIFLEAFILLFVTVDKRVNNYFQEKYLTQPHGSQPINIFFLSGSTATGPTFYPNKIDKVYVLFEPKDVD